MVMKDKQRLLSLRAIRVENPSTLINSFCISVEHSWTNELFYLCLIYSDRLDYELLFLCMVPVKFTHPTRKTYYPHTM